MNTVIELMMRFPKGLRLAEVKMFSVGISGNSCDYHGLNDLRATGISDKMQSPDLKRTVNQSHIPLLAHMTLMPDAKRRLD